MFEIKSRWEIPVSELNSEKKEKHIDYLLRSKLGNSIINDRSKEFKEKYPQYDYSEIRSIAMFGFYRAIHTFKPERCNGNKKRGFINHACYAIRKCVTNYFKKNYSLEKIESNQINDCDSSFEIEDEILNDLMVEKLFKRLSESDRKILYSFYFLSDNPKQCKDLLGITWYKLDTKLNAALERARLCLKRA